MLISQRYRHSILQSIFMTGLLMACFLFPVAGYAGYADECTSTLEPGGSGGPLEIKGGEVKCVGAGTYHYGFVNIHGTIGKDGIPTAEGKLVFKDAKIDFWVKSLLVENGGSLIVGSEDEPISKNTVTIHLYGKEDETDKGITWMTKGILCMTSDNINFDLTCGVPRDRWRDGGSDSYTLPGNVEDKFYAYRKTDLQYVKGGDEGSYFGRKVLAVSYGGTLRMFGKKGAIYESDFRSLDPMKVDPSRVFFYNKPLAQGASHFDIDRVIDWQKGHPVLFKDLKSGKYEIREIKDITITRVQNDFHTNLIIDEGLTQNISSEGGYIVLLHNSGKSWGRLADSIPAKDNSRTLTLDRDVDWQAGDRIVVTTTDYLPGHSEELTIKAMEGNKITFTEPLQYPHNGRKYSLAGHNIPDRLKKDGFKIEEVETRAAVALLTRNIRIVSEGDDYPKPLAEDSFFGGHTIVRQGFKQYQVQGVEFYQLGQGGRAARMPVNFFLTRLAPAGTFVRDCSINGSMTHWIELRGAHNVSLERNVGYKSIGHGYVLADGTEINNTLRGNIGIFARAAVDNIQNPRKVPGILADMGSIKDLLQNAGDAVHPAIFFIANGYNNFDYNMAAGAATCGACYWIPQARGALSESQYNDVADYSGMQTIGARSAPIKLFRGNFCSTAMHSLITIGNVGACDGVVKEPFLKPIFDQKLRALNNTANVTIAQGPLNANLKIAGCDNVQKECEDEKCTPLNEIFARCVEKNKGKPEYCEKEKNDYTRCTQDCGKMRQVCEAPCDKGNTYNCAATVIEDYTSSFHWASTNVSAIWLRTNWFLMTDSVLTDVQNGGLTMVSGGTYDQVINGYWALTRKSAFIGHTQEGNPYATNAGPVSPGSPLKCVENKNFCALPNEGISFPTENFSVYQRLYNIYDGPVYQEANAFLNIKERLIDCHGGKDGNCQSDYMYGSGGRGVGIPRAKEKPYKKECVLPNAAIGWKQPNGFYYPPAFYSQNLYFDNVDLRHFIIIPLFHAGTYTVKEKKLKEEYCTYPVTPTALFQDTWTDIDRQTELNDIDGTLSGLANTISVNNDKFFSVPLQPDECLSEQTCFQVPYDYITAVAFPDEGARKNPPVNLGDNVWMQQCDKQACHGVPIYRQLLKENEEVGQQQMARMMGGGISQRSVMIYNNGVYYIDTSINNSNLFESGKKYDFFLLYPKDTSRVTFQVYVGEDFKDDGAADEIDIKQIRIYTKKPEIPGVNPDYDPGKYQGGIDVRPLDSWPAGWKKSYEKGILTVTLDMTGVEFKKDFEDAREENCRPSSFCKWDGKNCVYANDPRNPSPYSSIDNDADKICSWSVKAPECPAGGCYGFQIRMPSGFDRKNAAGKRPAPRKYSDRKEDWCPGWEKLKWKTPDGEKAQTQCDYFNNKIDLPVCH